MGKLTSLLALCLVLSANALWAGEPDEASAKGDTAESTLKKKATSTPDGDSYKKFRFGGYGEMVASFKDYGINLSGLAIAAIAGILLNAILPGNDYEFDEGSNEPESASLRV